MLERYTDICRLASLCFHFYAYRAIAQNDLQMINRIFEPDRKSDVTPFFYEVSQYHGENVIGTDFRDLIARHKIVEIDQHHLA